MAEEVAWADGPLQDEEERELGDIKNDDKQFPPDVDVDVDVNVASMAPTPTEMFPVELRTSPPTPSLLFPPNLQTAPPTKEGATWHPTYEPTTGPTTASPLPLWKQAVVVPINTVRTEWDADDTIVTTVLLTVFIIVTFVYCVCCKRNKESRDTDTWGRRPNKGDYSAIETQDYSGSPPSPTTFRPAGSGQPVVVHNPMAETSPLLSPPRNKEKLAARKDAREQRDREQVPVRAPRTFPSVAPRFPVEPEETLGGGFSDIDGDLNI